MPWWTYAAIGGLSLVILRTGIPMPILLGACALVVIAALIWDRVDTWSRRRKRARQIVWKDLLSCEIRKVQEDDRPALYARLTNTGDQDLQLPTLSVWLGFSTFAGGTPALGGNGLDSIGLRENLSRGQSLRPGESIDLPIDTAAAPVRPAALPRPPRRPSGQQADQARAQRLDAAYAKLAAQISAAPSLADFMESDEAVFLDLRADGQYPGFGFFSPGNWTEKG